MAISRATATTILRNLGWRVRTTSEYTVCVRNFQAAWNLGTALAVDGSVGEKTSAALLLSESRRRAGRPTASPNFGFKEVACRCWGSYASCQRIWIKRSTLQMMERYRAHNGAFYPVSACRCSYENRVAGGSPTSDHLIGMACDVPARWTVATVRGWGTGATHYGYGSASHLVKHLSNSTRDGASVSRPFIYVDGR